MKPIKTILVILLFFLSNQVHSQPVFEGDQFNGLKHKVNPNSQFSLGDKITEDFKRLQPNHFNSNILAEKSTDLLSSVQPQITVQNKTNYLPYIFGGSGLVAAGGGLVFHLLTEKKYDDYKAAQTPSDATRLYDDVENYELARDVSLGVGAVLVIWGIMSYFDKPEPQQNTSDYSFYFESGQNKESFGIGLQVNLDHIGIIK